MNKLRIGFIKSFGKDGHNLCLSLNERAISIPIELIESAGQSFADIELNDYLIREIFLVLSPLITTDILTSFS